MRLEIGIQKSGVGRLHRMTSAQFATLSHFGSQVTIHPECTGPESAGIALMLGPHDRPQNL